MGVGQGVHRRCIHAEIQREHGLNLVLRVAGLALYSLPHGRLEDAKLSGSVLTQSKDKARQKAENTQQVDDPGWHDETPSKLQAEQDDDKVITLPTPKGSGHVVAPDGRGCAKEGMGKIDNPAGDRNEKTS